jgi:hypothetical protein
MTGRLPYHVLQSTDYVSGEMNMVPAKTPPFFLIFIPCPNPHPDASLASAGFKNGSPFTRFPFVQVPAKLKQVGYATHQIGKWHLGGLLAWMTPHGRGFDTSFGYLGGAEDHYTHMASEFGCVGVDLWRTDAVANTPDYNGTYSAYMYNGEIQKVLASHEVRAEWTHKLLFS